MHIWLKLTLLILLSVSPINTATAQQSTPTTVKLLNSGSDYLAHMQQAGMIDNNLSSWSLPDTHVILMGNVLDTNSDLIPQIQTLEKLVNLAVENNAKLSVVMGQTEYELGTKARLNETVGQWLNSLPEFIQIGENIISHRGLSLTAALNSSSDSEQSIHHSANYMGSQICHPLFEADRLRQVLDKKAASKLWVAQAQDFSAPWQKRLSDQLHILNKGVMATISNGRATVNLVDGSDVLFAEKSPARYPENPVGMSDAEILDILTNGEVIGEEAIPVGITKPMKLTINHNDKLLNAAFKSFDDARGNHKGKWKIQKRYADRYFHEVAAFKLDRKLSIGLVPATVVRSVDGTEGSVQVWYDNLMSKLSYKEADEDYQGHCDRKAQRNMMRVFDYLIMNEDRNQTNILHNKTDWQVWYIDHSRAFSDSIRRTEQMRKAADIYLTPEFRKVLEEIDRDQLNTLRPWLHKRRIKIMDRRREFLLSGKVNDL